MRQVADIFQQLDENGDGTVDWKELQKAVGITGWDLRAKQNQSGGSHPHSPTAVTTPIPSWLV